MSLMVTERRDATCLGASKDAVMRDMRKCISSFTPLVEKLVSQTKRSADGHRELKREVIG